MNDLAILNNSVCVLKKAQCMSNDTANNRLTHRQTYVDKTQLGLLIFRHKLLHMVIIKNAVI